MPGSNDTIADGIISFDVSLQRWTESERQRIMAFMEDMQGDIADQIRRIDPTGVARQSYRLKRLQRLQRETSKIIRQGYDRSWGELNSDLKTLGELAGKRYADAINIGIGADIATSTITKGDIAQILHSPDTIFKGPAKYWWDKQGRDLRGRFNHQMRLGVTSGETNSQLVSRVIGKSTGVRRVVRIGKKKRILHEYTGGIMNTSRREATTLVRTSAMGVANNVKQKVYEENADLVESLRALATLDARTSDICKARDGAVWNMKTGRHKAGTPGAGSFPGYPPWHWNCRTVIVPVTKSWEQLAKEAGAKKSVRDKLKEVPQGKRASMNGQVSGDMTYGDWLKKQTKATQRDILGPGRYDLWKDGKIGVGDLVTSHGNPLTLKQLMEKYGDTSAKVKKVVKKTVKRVTKVTPPTAPPTGAAKRGADFRADLAERMKKIESDVGGMEARRNALEPQLKAQTRKYKKSKPGSRARAQSAVELDRLTDVSTDLNDRITAKKREVWRAWHETLKVDDPIDMKVRLRGRFDNTTEARDFLQSITSRGVLKDLDRKRGFALLVERTADNRASADSLWRNVYIGQKTPTRIVVHEMAHVLEHHSNIYRKTQSFLRARAGSDPLELLSKVTGIKKYGADEMTWKDKFFHPYVGKECNGLRSTELLSMGVEYLFADPAKFAQADPEMFDMIIDVLRGIY